jgi:hypothetical protein
MNRGKLDNSLELKLQEYLKKDNQIEKEKETTIKRFKL